MAAGSSNSAVGISFNTAYKLLIHPDEQDNEFDNTISIILSTFYLDQLNVRLDVKVNKLKHLEIAAVTQL